MSHVMTASILPAIQKAGIFDQVKALKASNIGAGPTLWAKDQRGVWHIGVQEVGRVIPAKIHFAAIIFKRGKDLYLWMRKDLEALGTATVPADRLAEGLHLSLAA